MPELNVIVRGKIAQGVKGQYAVCENSDYTVKFDFDDDWRSQKYKTARFIWNDKYEDVVFEGDECSLPIVSDTYCLKVGVFAGDLQTTTPAIIVMKKSILCGSATAEKPSEDVYSQIMALLNDLKELSGEELAAAIEKYLTEHPIGGASDFTIKMAVASGEDGYTVTSCDATVEQIDAAVAAKKRVVLIATDTASGLFWEMPIIFGSQGNSYEFGTFLEGQVIVSFVDKVGENESKWQFMLTKIAAEAVDYSNAALSYVSTVGEALDKLVSDSHTHKNKGTLDKLSNSNGKLQYNGSDVSLKPTYYIDLAGTYPNYTCPVTMDDIKAAYNSGYNLVCRCTLGVYTATLPLFVPMPAANTWIFSGSGALQSMDFPAQSFTIAITANGVVAQNSLLTNKQLNITVGGTTYHYDGSEAIGVTVKAPVKLVTTVGEIVYLVDNTEYRLADITTLTLNYPAGEFECWMRLSFAASGDITVTLPAGTGYIGSAPDFKNGETWELSFKDKILAAQKVGEGT